MYLAYIDESGDRGIKGSHSYTLGCLLVRASQWKTAFDGVIGFRRFLKDTVRVSMRAEIKANHLIRNSGDFRRLGLSEHSRHFIYKGLLQLQAKLGLSVFAIVIDKSKLHPDVDPLIQAWIYLLQRLETLSRKNHEEVMIIHDEGELETIRKLRTRNSLRNQNG